MLALDHAQSLLQLRLCEPGDQCRGGVRQASAVQQSAGIGDGILRRVAQYLFVAGQFLIQAQTWQCEPCQRVEPEQGRGQFGKQAPPCIATSQVQVRVGAALVRNPGQI